CDAKVQPVFERGLALLHSFAYVKAAKTFEEVSAKDPGCGMAQWGLAMTYFHTIWGPPTDDEFSAGRAAAQKAADVGAPSARGRDYIAAIGSYHEGDGVPHPSRVVAYDKAMAGVAQRSPGDHEAAIFHALAILGVAYNSPPDKTYARQREAAKILNGLLTVEPDHPGIAHYMIHSFDYPEFAYLQTGQDAKAREVADNVAKVTSFDIAQFAAGYALAAVPARHALERRAWSEAAAVTAQPATFPWAKYPYAKAIVHFARAVGAARAGDANAARSDVATLTEIQA